MEQHTCVDCGSASPETNTSYTLISSRHGWRLTRMRAANGSVVMEWRCPGCWQAHKEARGVPLSTREPEPPPAAPRRDSPRAFFARATRRLTGQKSEPPPARD